MDEFCLTRDANHRQIDLRLIRNWSCFGAEYYEQRSNLATFSSIIYAVMQNANNKTERLHVSEVSGEQYAAGGWQPNRKWVTYTRTLSTLVRRTFTVHGNKLKFNSACYMQRACSIPWHSATMHPLIFFSFLFAPPHSTVISFVACPGPRTNGTRTDRQTNRQTDVDKWFVVTPFPSHPHATFGAFIDRQTSRISMRLRVDCTLLHKFTQCVTSRVQLHIGVYWLFIFHFRWFSAMPFRLCASAHWRRDHHSFIRHVHSIRELTRPRLLHSHTIGS